MVRTLSILLAAVLVALAGTARAAPEGLAGTWKIVVPMEGQARPLWLIKFESRDGKWSGSVTATGERVPRSTVADVSASNGLLRFTIKLEEEGAPRLSFEGKLPQEGVQKAFGSLVLGRQLIPVQLELTTLQTLDSYELAKETLAKQTTGPEVIDAVTIALGHAGAKKAKPEEVRSWADKGMKAAELYGPRLQRETTIRIAETLVGQEGFAPVALEYARRAERLLEPRDKPNTQKRVLDVLAEALKKAGKADEVKEVETRISKIEPVRPEPFAGRKSKNERVVLVELFTGAQCPPCVPADLAFDALEKTYKPAEVVCLQYHEHIPGPDPLTNADSESRQGYYVRGPGQTPMIFFNGKLGTGAGGRTRFDAQDNYEEFQSAIAPLLETTATAKLKATATQKDAKIEINAEVTDLERPGETVHLRLALVEEQVSYTGGNKLPTHHNVVRAFPGGVKGVPLKEKTAKTSATVDLDELRKSLNKYLDAEKDPFPNKDRPMEFKKLRVVAFIQNDTTKEVLQAVQVEVSPQK